MRPVLRSCRSTSIPAKCCATTTAAKPCGRSLHSLGRNRRRSIMGRRLPLFLSLGTGHGHRPAGPRASARYLPASAGWVQASTPEIHSYPVADDLALPFQHLSFVRESPGGRSLYAETFFCLHEDRVRPDEQGAPDDESRSATGASRSAGRWCAKACAIRASRCWSSSSSPDID